MSELRKVIDPHFESFWNGSLSKYNRLNLSRNMLDEKHLKYLLEQAFVTGFGIGGMTMKSKMSEKEAQQSFGKGITE